MSMDETIMVDYAVADAWKQRAESAAKAERLARQAVKAALIAVKAGSIMAPQMTKRARLASEAAVQAAKEAEKVWADTADTLHEKP